MTQAPAALDSETGRAVPGIRLRALRKVFGRIVAVDSIDLDIIDGEFFAVLGPSGSGKTTVLRMIAGFESPTTGTIELGGVNATRIPPFRRDVNTVFQDYALFPHMSVQQNVEYGLRVKKVPRAERTRRAHEALEMVRLADLGDRRPEQLSGGQRQRIALARALVNRPKVLLLDEPLGALDLKLREQMQVELKSIQRDVGITFVFVTHDQDEALTLCDRLAVMRDGRLEQVGAAGEVYENPATRFVAEFVGSSNVVSGGLAEKIFGTSHTVAVRPEKMRVIPRGSEPAPGEGSVSGAVTEVVYAGQESRIVVQAAGATFTAVQLNTVAGADGVARGDTVTLAWHPDSVRKLTD